MCSALRNSWFWWILMVLSFDMSIFKSSCDFGLTETTTTAPVWITDSHESTALEAAGLNLCVFTRKGTPLGRFDFPDLSLIWGATSRSEIKLKKIGGGELVAFLNLSCVTTGSVRCWHEHSFMFFITVHWAQRPASDRFIYLCGFRDTAAIWVCVCKARKREKTHMNMPKTIKS